MAIASSSGGEASGCDIQTSEKIHFHSRNEPIRATTTTNLCRQCGHSLKTKLRVRSTENLNRIRSGFIPSLSEYDMILKLLVEAEEDMTRYTKELDRLRDVSAMLQNKQKTLETYIGDLRCVLSPIRRMPAEILGEIFRHLCCVGVGTNHLHVSQGLTPAIDFNCFPTCVLACVCSRWRTLVKSMPALWSSFHVRSSSRASPTALVKHFLQTSSLHPIDIRIAAPHPSFHNENNIDLLVSQGNRWRHVILDLRHALIGRKVFHPLIVKEKELPELMSLTIGPDPTIDGNRDSQLPLECPKLHSLRLDGFNLDLQVPRPSIETLELTILTPRRISHLIENSPNVQEISLKKCSVNFDDPSFSPEITSNVRKLKLDFGGGAHIAENALLDNMTLPCLTSLSVLDTANLPPYRSEPLISMLDRSHCPLTHLSITISLTDEELLTILYRVPTVTHLKVGESGKTSMVTDTLLQRLTVSGDHVSSASSVSSVETAGNTSISSLPPDECLLPHLTDLSLEVRPNFEDDVFMVFVESRWRLPASASSSAKKSGMEMKVSGGIARLRRLHVKRATGVQFDDLRRRLNQIAEQGLVVSF